MTSQPPLHPLYGELSYDDMPLSVTHKNGEPYFGDEPLLPHIAERTFSSLFCELITERVPDADELALVDLILMLSLDHGRDTPSAQATLKAEAAGKEIGAAVGEGIATIGERHGGAQEHLMEILYAIERKEMTATEVVKQFLAEKKRIPGFGHRLYENDPRAELIMREVSRLGLPPKFLDIARDIERTLANARPDKQLPLNIDGAIAVALATLGWKSEWSQAIFIAARSGGLCAQYLNAKAQ